MTEPAASVVLCVRNAAATVGQQLEGLAAQDFDQPWELVVVDNGSTDATVAIVSEWTERIGRVRVIPAPDKPSLSYARNVGVRAARGTVVAFCDGDDVVGPGWLRALWAGCRRTDLVCGRLDITTLNSPRAIFWRGVITTDELPVGADHLPYAVGANFAVRRERYLEVGGCDEGFTICSDDVDFSWRVQEAGGSIGYAGGAVVAYRLREDLRSALRQKWNYGQAEARLFAKHRPAFRRQPGRDTFRAYLYLLTRFDHLVRGEKLFGMYACAAVYRAGRLRGSIRNRVLWY